MAVDIDGACAALSRAGGDLPALRAWLDEWGHDERLLLQVLQHPVAPRLLEHLGVTRPWCERPLVAGAVARHARTPAHVGLRLLGVLGWRDLALCAASPWIPGAVRVRAEGLLVESLPDLRRGDRIALARLATPALLRALLEDTDELVLEAALLNPRLAEDALVSLLRGNGVSRALLEHAARSPRWRASYAVRRALVLQPRTPLPLALSQITSLHRGDLRRASGDRSLAPLVRAAAERAQGPRDGPESA